MALSGEPDVETFGKRDRVTSETRIFMYMNVPKDEKCI